VHFTKSEVSTFLHILFYSWIILKTVGTYKEDKVKKLKYPHVRVLNHYSAEFSVNFKKVLDRRNTKLSLLAVGFL
jgi:hypothetical protein